MHTQIVTSGDPQDDICEGLADNDLSEWLQGLNLSQDAINKIKRSNNLSFKKIQTLSLHDRSLSKQIADHLSLNLLDSLTFLDGIEDLRKQQINETVPLVEKYKYLLDSNYKQQQKIVNNTFNELMDELKERKSKTLHILQKIYSHKKSELNEPNTANFDTKLVFSMQNKSEIVENIRCLGVINHIDIKIPMIKIQHIASNSITIAINDVSHKSYKYEVHYARFKDTSMSINTATTWKKQSIDGCNLYNNVCIKNLKQNILYFIRIKKINTLNQQFVMSKVMEANTVGTCAVNAVSDNLEMKEMETNDVNINSINWDKSRHGINVNFISNNCIETGAYSLALCDSMILMSNSIDNRYFLWEISVDRIAKESSFIGYINGPLSKYDTNVNITNVCLTEGKRNHTNQFAIAFNNKSKYIQLFGKNRTYSKLTLETCATNGDKFLFVVDWMNKYILLYHNRKKVGTVFKNISNCIIPAVSGRSAQYTIHIITDATIITKQQPKSSSSWSFWGKPN